MKTAANPAFWTRVYGVLGFICLAVELSKLHTWLPVITLDVSSCYLPWYSMLLHLGRFRGISGAYANYTPPTLYLFSLLSLLPSHSSPNVLLKMINMPFILASSAFAYFIGRQLGATKWRSGAVALIVLALPEAWENALHWGQYDSVYTTFLLGTALAVLHRRNALAMVIFGSALAFKLQAIFAGPALLGLLLAGELEIWTLALIPLAYVMWMVPAALAGRSWNDLLLVYGHQYGLLSTLSVSAPNFYLLVQPYVSQGTAFRLASMTADVLAVAASVWMAWRYRVRADKSAGPSEAFLWLMTLSQLAVPYLLPRMHERYYFAGNIFAALLLLRRPRSLAPLILLQGAALATYHQYFVHAGYDQRRSLYVLPVVLLFGGLALVVVEFRRVIWPVESRL